jgi:hypothetical protein
MLNRFQDILGRIVGRPGSKILPLWTVDETTSPYGVPNLLEWLKQAEASDRAKLGHLLAGLM